MQIKSCLKALNRTQLWLLVQLYNRGVIVHESDLCRILNGSTDGRKRGIDRIISNSEEIVTEEKNRIIKEIEDAFA